MEPVDPVADYLSTRGTLRLAALKVYSSTTDAFADSVAIRGSRSNKFYSMRGEVQVTTCTWMIASCSPDVELPRPALGSKIVSQGETWKITSERTSPRNDRLIECECELIPGG